MKKVLSIVSFTLMLFGLMATLQLKPAQAAGEHSFNIRFEPVLLVVGYLNAEADYKFADQMTLGPAVSLWNIKVSDVSVRASSAAVQGRYYFLPAFTDSSWFLAAQLGYASLDAEIVSNSTTYKGSASGATVGAGGGYHWFWHSFNMSLGGSLNTGSASNIELKDSGGNKYKSDTTNPSVGFGIDYSLGWTF